MDQVHFLNLEYIVLHISDVLFGYLNRFFSFITGTPESTVATEGINSHTVATHTIETFSFGTTQLALLGFALAVVLLVMSVWIRLKLEVMEHAGFHARDAKYHTHEAHGETHDARAATEQSETQVRWEEITHLANSASESDWRRAIMEADIMLGEALAGAGYRGATVGDRLKDANPLQMTTLDIAWQAHKVRNQIAHEGTGFHLSEWDTKATIDFYRRVLEELAYI